MAFFKTDTVLDLIETDLYGAFNADSGTVATIARAVDRLNSGDINTGIQFYQERYKTRIDTNNPVIIITGGIADWTNRAICECLVLFPYQIHLIWRRLRATQSGLEADKQKIDGYSSSVIGRTNTRRYSNGQMVSNLITKEDIPKYIVDEDNFIIYQTSSFELQYLSDRTIT